MTDEKRVGPNIVAAWFGTVINPILQGLEVERERLSRKSWTWQFMPGRLESIRRVREMVLAMYWPNLDHFLGFYPAIKTEMDFHDGEVTKLFVACQKLQSRIMKNGEFKKVVARATSEEALRDLGKSLSDLFGGATEMDQRGWIAQCIVNGSGELPRYIMHAPLWNKHRDEFMRVLEDPSVSDAQRGTDRAGEKLLQLVEGLIGMLTETRADLSVQYDVAPVPIPLTLVK